MCSSYNARLLGQCLDNSLQICGHVTSVVERMDWSLLMRGLVVEWSRSRVLMVEAGRGGDWRMLPVRDL